MSTPPEVLIHRDYSNDHLVEIKDTTRDLVAASIIGAISGVVILVMYSFETKPKAGHTILASAILLGFFLLYLTVGRFFIPDHAVLPYLFPVAGFGHRSRFMR